MKEFNYTITDSLGIHARPAGQLVKVAKTLDSTVTIHKGEKSAAATKLMALMGMGIKGGDVITVTVDGGNEEAGAQVIEQFLRDNL